MAIASRPYRDADDFRRLREMLVKTYPMSVPPLNCHVGDLDWWVFPKGQERLANARVWEDDSGKLAGVAWPSGDEVDLFVHPRRHQIEAEMIAWAEERRADARPADAEKVQFCVWATGGDGHREEILIRRGYAKAGYFLRCRIRPLGEPTPTAGLPEGYSIRSYRGEEDLERRAGVHRDAFAPSEYTAERHRRLLQAPTYRMDRDLVAVAPDGAFAAFTIVWYDEVNRVGVFEPVGTHPRHRGRGVGKAILSAGLRLMEQLGATKATVQGRGDNLAASRLYESLGFREHGRYYRWKKNL